MDADVASLVGAVEDADETGGCGAGWEDEGECKVSLLRGPKMNATRRRKGGRPQREAMFALSGAVRHVFAIFAGIRNPATDGGTKAAGSLGGGRRPVAAGIATSTSRHQRGFRPSARPGAGAGRGGPRCLPRCGRTRGRARRAGHGRTPEPRAGRTGHTGRGRSGWTLASYRPIQPDPSIYLKRLLPRRFGAGVGHVHEPGGQ